MANNNNNGNNTNIVKTSAKAGISFGACLAMIISYVKWNSIIWAVIHGLMGWIYVVYYIIRYGWH